MYAGALGAAVVFALAAAGEGDNCREQLFVATARATFKTPMFQGRAVRRDAELEVEITSTATAPVTMVELGVFLGASMKAIAETRPSALPTARPRELEDGGVAFRAEVPVLISPGTTRVVRFTKSSIPLDRDVSAVTAVIAGCRTARVVSSDSTIDPRAGGESSAPGAIAVFAFLFGLVLVVVMLVRILR